MFLDIAVAIVVTKLVSLSLHQDPSALLFMFAICSSLFPDIDILSPAVKKYFFKKQVINHRTFLHYPALYILPSLLLLTISGKLAFIFSICIFLHFVHDTFFLGWGVLWLWPFSSTRFKCFPDRDGKIVNLGLVTWKENEEKEIIRRYHNPHWIQDFYLRPNIVAYIEYGAIFLAFIILIFL